VSKPPQKICRLSCAYRTVACLAVAFTLVAFGQAPHAQVPGRNINMVSGDQWPTGDPFLQRQNEPSLAASTRNPLHLLAGANDYRTVDVPGLPDGAETGDAWLGLFKSFDGGQRWQSGLLPGFPQDTSAEGLASPLHGYHAGADPVVRPGTNGLFYYSGIVFDRGAGAKSRVFVSRFIDNNNLEAGDPVRYLGAKAVASEPAGSPAFLDKPWIAVDIPRAGGKTCTITTPSPEAGGDPIVQQVKAGNVYVVYSRIVGAGSNTRSTIMFSKSIDCGSTFSTPVALSTDPVSQGATLAIDPITGTVFVAWRQFGLGTAATDSIVATRLLFGAAAFDRPTRLRQFFANRTLAQLLAFLLRERILANTADVGPNIEPFDQTTLADRFRTNAYPTMAIDGSARVYVAWTERGFGQARPDGADGDARVVMATSLFGIGWSQPFAIDSGPLPGHQLMPSLTFAGGKLVLVYYDLRRDVSQVFGPWVSESDALLASGLRHTVDIRATQASPGLRPVFSPSIQISEYLIGSRPGSPTIEQLQFNPPDLPLFQAGSVPFIGDYVDVVPAPAFVVSNGKWIYNTAASSSSAFQVAWTDNRDVRPPPDDDWTTYTPPGVSTGTSVFTGGNDRPACVPDRTGMRNQNVYSTRLTGGLLAGSPGNTKPLSPSVPRGFVVFAQNMTESTRSYRFTIASQPTGGRASFNQVATAPLLTTVDAAVPARSTVTRTVFVTSTDPHATVPVSIAEIAAPGAPAPLAGGASSVVQLNPDASNPAISNPAISNPAISNPDIANAEVYNPAISNPAISNPAISNPAISNPAISNPAISNVVITNTDIVNPAISNPAISNPAISNADITNPAISNADIANGAISDVTWTVTNTGNTTATFDVNLFLTQATIPAGIKAQLVLSRVYKTPVSDGCTVKFEAQSQLVSNIVSPAFLQGGQTTPTDPNNPAISNAALWIEPGGSAQLTLRVVNTNPGQVAFNPATAVTPVVTSVAVNTPDLGGPTPVPPSTQPPTTSVPVLSFYPQPAGGTIGQPLAAFAVRAVGQNGPLAGVEVTIALGSNPSGGSLGGVLTTATDGAGLATFTGITFQRAGSGYTLVASATDANAVPVFSSTFSVTAAAPAGVVTNANDSGPGSLREAMAWANGHAGADSITFAIPGVGPHVVSLGSPLPPIIDTVAIDGTTQPGYGGAPVVEINGASAGAGARGFEINAPATTIRGLAVTGFSGPGVFAWQPHVGHTIEDNDIGTDAAGSAGKGNGVGLVMRASQSTVRRNVISGNAVAGIVFELGASGSTIANNRIGTSPNGLAALANGAGVILYDGSSFNTLTGNLIAGNGQWGLDIQQTGVLADVSDTTITSNTVGLNAAGSALGNGGGGIRLFRAIGTRVGTAGAGNVISGNGGPGVLVDGTAAVPPVIQGNRIGTDPSGMAARANRYEGIVLMTPATVGGTGPGEGNLISGNGDFSIAAGTGVLVGPGGGGSVVRGNLIGLDATGAAALGNGYSGITVSALTGVVIGGTTPGAGNVISGNPYSGISLYQAYAANPDPDGTVIQGNFIGTDVGGTTAVGNGFLGIDIAGATNVVVGGAAPGAGNLISGNGVSADPRWTVRGGVGVFGANSTGNAIRSNSIAGNAGLGIDLGAAGVTANDALDADGGPNGLQNFPVVTGASNGSDPTTRADFTVSSAPSASFSIEFFASPTCSVSGHGEGYRLVGSTSVATDGSGNAAGSFLLDDLLPVGQVITATITDAAGNTSEFSACRAVTAPPPPAGVISSASPTPVAAGVGQMLTIRGTGMPGAGGGDVLFTQGANVDLPAHYAWAAGPTQAVVRLPISGLAAGVATVRIKNPAGTISTAPFPITISATPAAPVLLLVEAGGCGGGGPLTPATAVTAGQFISVEADGLDTYGTVVVFTPATGPAVAVSYLCASLGSLGGVAASVQVPAGMALGPMQIQVRTMVNSVSSPLSNAITVTLQ
jgi:hypothetical protein